MPLALKSAGLVLLPFLALFGAAQLASLTVASAVMYFLPAMLVPFILSRLNFLPFERSILLLMMFVGVTHLMPAESNAALVAMTAGLLVWKLADNLLQPENSTLEDLMPSLIWLGTVYWTSVGGATVDGGIADAIVLGTLATSFFTRWVQRPLLAKGDPVYLKRIMLTATSGLTMLCIITKVVGATGMMVQLAAVAGTGFLFSYILETIDNSKEEFAIKGLKQLIYIGILTLAASRLFGMLGVLVLAASMLVATTPGTALVAGAYWVMKAMAQTFVAQYNPNVTGVNLTHSYTSAALYAGFLAVVVLSLFIRDSKDKRMLLILLLGGATVLPFGSNYFVHPEPTAGLLIAASVASVLMTVLGKAIHNRVVEASENLILLPGVMSCAAILSYELLEKGEGATTQERLIAIGVFAGLVILVGIVNHFMSNKPKTPESNSVTTQPASGS